MENKKQKTLAISTVVLTILLISSTLMLCSSVVVKESTFARPLSATTTNYGDLLQYDWDQAGADEGCTGWNLGPAPERPNILWKRTVSGSGMVSAFDGKIFTASGTTVYAWDGMTGVSVYNSTAPTGVTGIPSTQTNNGIFRIDNTYFVTQGGSGITVRRISDGQFVAYYSTVTSSREATRHPGSGSYFAGHYSEGAKMAFETAYDPVAHQALIVAISVADPTQPREAWAVPVDTATELLCSGDGMVFLGSTEAEVIALNATTGQIVWQAATQGGIIQQSAMYYNHKLYTSAVSWQITCFDGFTGEKIWQAEKGIRAFSAYRGAIGDGMLFESTVEIDPYGSVGAWDAETGERLWKQPGYYNIHYATMAYADGKVYGIKCDRAAGSSTAGLLMPGTSFSCWDAYTGTELWNLPNIGTATPSIAYGNLYLLQGSTLYCIGGEPKDWEHGLIGNVEQPRIAVGQQGPTDISTPKWMFQTEADISTSPAVVDGKVYFGSADKNVYCLDAFTGEKIWNFAIGTYVRSSPTVVGGKVFIGADDGYFYAIDATTGTQAWKTSAGGFFPYLLDVNEADARSSPVIVGGQMYCGALDGKVYCLNTANGNVQWTYTTGGPIFGTAAYLNGIIYIASGDGYLYALNANNGNLVWKSAFNLTGDIVPPSYCEWWNIGTPTIGGGLVYIGGGVQYGNALFTGNAGNAYYASQGQSTPSGANGGGIRMFAFNAATGASVWNQSRAGNTQPLWVPAYINGNIYAGEFFEVTAMSATNPNSTGTVDPVPDFVYTNRRSGVRIWASWVGYQISDSVGYADDLTGPKIYIGSDIGSIYCFNATGGATYSVFTAGGNVASSPTVWDGKMYIGTTEGILYCFDDSPTVTFNMWADANKGIEMWNNETLSIGGQLTSNPMMSVWDYNSAKYVPEPSQYKPALRNATVQIALTKPDGSNVQLMATTDNQGKFTIDYVPTETGTWGWVAYYEGKRTTGMTYDPVYSEFKYVNVVAAPVESTPQPTVEPTPTPTEAPVTAAPTETVAPTDTQNAPDGDMTLVYAAVAVIVIVVIAAVAYIFMKRSKKK